jgi:NAD(P)-dependent dehydrogenase (short-subunit alcohol dehydrogenase family)
MNRLKDQVILLAGAGNIGSGLALRYASEGAQVLIGDQNLEVAEQLASAVTAQGGQAQAIALDGASETSAKAAVAFCCEKLGGLDGIHINFASLADSDPECGALELSTEIFDEVQRVNARGALLCTQAALPALIARGGGTVLYTTSAAAHASGTAQLAYSMSKSAIHTLMRHVAKRYGAQGVRANAIAPALTFSAEIEPLLPEALVDMAKGGAAIKSRIGRPEDIAAMATLLMSSEGAYITGQVMNVDGGTVMRV